MCGIAGVWLSASAGADAAARVQALTDRMAGRLAHRGPDGQGRYVDNALGLAHTRLAIIDLAGGAQPLYNADRSLALVANGEIYNHLELRRELEGLGHRFATHSDSETLLHAYAAWGEGFLDRVQGMFALALHDVRRKQLILARDRLGIKPLYVHQGAEGLGFASEIKALRPILGRFEVEVQALAGFLQCNFTPGAHTLTRGVQRLPPGHMARIGADGVLHLRQYWRATAVEPLALGLDEALARFDALMHEVMAMHLRADVPFGLFLSGGVDSSLLAALISRAQDAPLRTWSVGFANSGVHNELAAAAAVAERLGTRHTALEVDADALLTRLPHAVWAADDLCADYANLPVSLLAEAAGQELKVVFSGEGGDEVFAGYGRYRMPWLRRQWAAWRHPGSGGFRTRGLFERGGADLFQPELARAVSAWRAPFVSAWGETPRPWSDLMRRQYVDLVTWLPDDLLIKADRMLMAWGVEGRVPFLDHRVVEFGLALPDALKVEAGSGKRFLRHWGERFLPREHLWSRKRGFTVPVRDWLCGPWLERYARVVPHSAAVQAWFAPGAVARLIEMQRRSGRLAAPLWAILNFALWHHLFIDGDGQAPPRRCDPLALLAGQDSATS